MLTSWCVLGSVTDTAGATTSTAAGASGGDGFPWLVIHRQGLEIDKSALYSDEFTIHVHRADSESQFALDPRALGIEPVTKHLGALQLLLGVRFAAVCSAFSISAAAASTVLVSSAFSSYSASSSACSGSKYQSDGIASRLMEALNVS